MWRTYMDMLVLTKIIGIAVGVTFCIAYPLGVATATWARRTLNRIRRIRRG